MDYRDILRDQLRRRQEINPRFSLRSFASKLEVSPSKISEVLAGKKKFSSERLEKLADLLSLKGQVREIFLVSGEMESNRAHDKEALREKWKKLLQELNSQKTNQRNAWYFGAVQCLEERGIDSCEFRDDLGLTELQIENAKRFRKRMARFHPERRDLTFEFSSIAKKINESLQDEETSLHSDFALLTCEEKVELQSKIRSLLKKFKLNSSKKPGQKLYFVYFGLSHLMKERV